MKIKNKELATASDDELDKKLKDLRSELMKINTQIAVGSMLKSPGHAKVIKKAIARIYTIRANKQKISAQKKAGDEDRRG